MKYKKHTIVKVPADLGEEDSRKNFVYEIYNENGERIATALTLSTAKEFISSGCNENYL